MESEKAAQRGAIDIRKSVLLVLLLVLLLGGLGALVIRGLWLDRQAAPSLGGHLTEADVEAGDAQGWPETCDR